MGTYCIRWPAVRILGLCLLLGILGGCAPSSERAASYPAEAAGSACVDTFPPDFPLVGTWQEDGASNCFLRIRNAGQMTMEAVMTRMVSLSVDGVTTTRTSEYVRAIDSGYEIKNETVSLLLPEDTVTCEMSGEGGTYRLVGETDSYTRVGGLDYEIQPGSAG